jgi:predicted RecB family endonuclease
MESVDDLFDCFDEDESKAVTQPVLVKENEENDVEIM